MVADGRSGIDVLGRIRGTFSSPPDSFLFLPILSTHTQFVYVLSVNLVTYVYKHSEVNFSSHDSRERGKFFRVFRFFFKFEKLKSEHINKIEKKSATIRFLN